MPGLDDMLGRKIGPAPVWLWVMGAGAIGVIGFRFMKVRSGASGASSDDSTGAGNSFQSTQSTTGTDAEGNQVTTSYSAQGNGYLPGMLTPQAGAMSYSAGDVYVNLPANQVQNQPDAAPGPLANVQSHVFPGSTNLTWTLGRGDTTDVLITAHGPNFTVNESVDTRGEKSGDNGGHMFLIDQPSRGATVQYTLTPLNNKVAGPASSITAKNAA